MDQRDAAANFLSLLNREFPQDPEILYLSVHAYSDLSTRMAQDLGRTAPNSTQAHELNAESMEIQGKWDEAEKEYLAVLAKDPNQQGIHFRLGRLLLSKPNPAPDAQERAAQNSEGTEIRCAGASILGEIARQQSQWPEALNTSQGDAAGCLSERRVSRSGHGASGCRNRPKRFHRWKRMRSGSPGIRQYYNWRLPTAAWVKDDAPRGALQRKPPKNRANQARPADAPAPQLRRSRPEGKRSRNDDA
jgi:hypothetical protein